MAEAIDRKGTYNHEIILLNHSIKDLNRNSPGITLSVMQPLIEQLKRHWTGCSTAMYLSVSSQATCKMSLTIVTNMHAIMETVEASEGLLRLVLGNNHESQWKQRHRHWGNQILIYCRNLPPFSYRKSIFIRITKLFLYKVPLISGSEAELSRSQRIPSTKVRQS